jgi:hypothetical protein
MAKKPEKESMLKRFAIQSGLGGLAGAVNSASGMHPIQHPGIAGGLGAIMGGGGSLIGDAILGGPERGDVLGDSARGALGGGILGGSLGAIEMGAKPGGAALVRQLIAGGMSKPKALALVLGKAAMQSAGAGAAAGGINQGLTALFNQGD